MLSIIDILKIRNFDLDNKVKLIRHQDARFDLNDLYRRGHLEIYQNYQGKDVFNCDYIVSFLGLEQVKALFIGIYKVNSKRIVGQNEKLPKDFPYQNMEIHGRFYYELEELKEFRDLKDRIIINWGSHTSSRSWHQWLKDKEIIEILPDGYIKEFPGFLDFTLDFYELKKIISNQSANKIWHTMLSSVAGIYMILDGKTGDQYIGSAYGEKGIIGRWTSYTSNGHGGNQKLKKLISKDPDYCNNFKFTILRTLPKTITKNEIIKYESFYKQKLGSRAFGLNLN